MHVTAHSVSNSECVLLDTLRWFATLFPNVTLLQQYARTACVNALNIADTAPMAEIINISATALLMTSSEVGNSIESDQDHNSIAPLVTRLAQLNRSIAILMMLLLLDFLIFEQPSTFI